MMFARHAARLAWEFGSYARVNQAWWLLLVLPILALAAFATTASHVVVPYTVYTLF